MKANIKKQLKKQSVVLSFIQKKYILKTQKIFFNLKN